jgi:hypothetical protein
MIGQSIAHYRITAKLRLEHRSSVRLVPSRDRSCEMDWIRYHLFRVGRMQRLLKFDSSHRYSSAEGIDIPTELRVGDQKVEMIASFCLRSGRRAVRRPFRDDSAGSTGCSRPRIDRGRGWKR